MISISFNSKVLVIRVFDVLCRKGKVGLDGSKML